MNFNGEKNMMLKKERLLSSIILSSILGMGLYAAPVFAETAATPTGITVGTTGGTQQTLTDTTLTSLYGNTYTNSTSGNTVSISGEGTAVTLAGETVSGGSKTSGILAGAYTTEAGDASNNTLSVTDGASVTFSSSYAGVAGGASMNGAASDNQVTLSGAFLSVPDGNSLDITGGVSGASAADNNVVTLTDLTSSTENQSVTGGESRALTEPSDGASAYSASNNRVTISASTEAAYADITGGRSTGNANGNVVSLTSTATDTDNLLTVSGNIYGGNSESGSAENNEVTLTGNGIVRDASNPTNTLPSIDVEGTIYGGNAAYGNASANTVSLTQVFASDDIYGGLVESNTTSGVNASGNTVSLTNSVANGEVYGGLVATGSSSASASGNTVTLTNSTAVESSIYGGYEEYDAVSTDVLTEESALAASKAATSTSTPAFSANASGNTVTLSNSTAQNSDIYGGYMLYYGDTSASVDAVAGANHNTVKLTDTSASGTGVYGGYVSGFSSAPALNANSNTVEISNTAEAEYGVSTVTGGYTDYGDANDNTVKITGTKVTQDDETTYLTSVRSDITGGETGSGNADGNTVTLDTIASSGTVYGGQAGSAPSGGGQVAAAAAFTSLVVAPVDESTETDTSTEADSIATSASGNIVTIMGSTIDGGVFGGLAGSASSNSGGTTYLTSLLAVATGDTADTSTGTSAMSISANDNTVTIADSAIGSTSESAGEIGGDVYGGYAGVSAFDLYFLEGASPTISLTASGNKVEMTNSTVSGAIYGGQTSAPTSYLSSLEDASPTITLMASGNKVEMTNSTVSGAIYGGLAGSASSSTILRPPTNVASTSESDIVLTSFAAASSSVDAVYINNANHNSVILKGTQTSSNVYGGYAGVSSSNNSYITYATESLAETSQTASTSTADTTGGASYNQVLIEEPAGNETDADITGYVFSPYVYGGYAVGGTAAVPYHTNGNEVSITYSDTTQLGYYGSVYGGWTNYGDASGNQVSITGAALTGNDTVTTNLELVGEGVNGGTTQNGNADNNTVALDHVTINSQMIRSSSMPGVIGGSVLTWSMSPVPVTLADGTVSTSASGNKVTLTDSVVTNSVSSGSEGPTIDVAGGYVINDGRDFLSSDTTNLAYEAAVISNQNTVSLTRSTAEMVEGGVASEYLMIMPKLTGSEEETEALAAPSGKLTVSATASGNTVTLTDSTVSGDVMGGSAAVSIEDASDGESGFDFSALTISANETASKNIVTLKGSTVEGVVIGGFTTQGTTSQNMVSLNADSAAALAAGGLSEMGTVSKNSVLLSDSKAEVLLGGYTLTGTASDNTVNVTGGSAASVYGGAAGTLSEEDAAALGVDTASMGSSPYASLLTSPAAVITATGNTVTITGGTIGNVWGGYAADVTETEDDSDDSGDDSEIIMTEATVMSVAALEEDTTTTTTTTTYNSGNASGNTVNYYGGTVTGNITGGESQSGAANDNIVNLYGTLVGSDVGLYGGVSSVESKGNTLNVYTVGNSVANVGSFQALNFNVPGNAVAGDTMLLVTGTADVSGAVVQAGVDDAAKLGKGQVINLITNAQGVPAAGTTLSMVPGKDVVTDAGFVQNKVSIWAEDNNKVVVGIPADSVPTLNPDTKLIPEQRVAAVRTIGNGSDVAMDSAYTAAVSAAGKTQDEEKGSFTPYAVMGANHLTIDTGSYVDTNGYAGNLGLVRQVKNANSTDTIIPFAEYGKSSYAAHLDNGARGDGDQHYGGVGLLLRRDLDNGVYYQGNLRVGTMDGDFRGVIAGHYATYDTDARYAAATLGAGRIYKTDDRNSVDVYGRFYYTHLGSDQVKLHSSQGIGAYNLDAVDSYRTRLGARWTHNYWQNQSYYAGLAWDYEFDSTARATYKTFATASPDSKGSSALLELGWKAEPTKETPWGGDVRLMGWAGKQRGVAVNATLTRRL